MVAKKKKTIAKPKIIIGNKEKRYWDYYSAVIFLVFSVLFIAILIIAMAAVFGKAGLWYVIPVTLVLWILSYLIAKLIFKRKK